MKFKTKTQIIFLNYYLINQLIIRLMNKNKIYADVCNIFKQKYQSLETKITDQYLPVSTTTTYLTNTGSTNTGSTNTQLISNNSNYTTTTIIRSYLNAPKSIAIMLKYNIVILFINIIILF